VFIAKRKKHLEGFIYDFAKGNHLSKLQNQKSLEKLSTFCAINVNDLRSTMDWPREHISHDFSLTIRFLTIKEQFEREICYSQLLTIKDQPLGRALIYFLDTFR
jgi:hypothetical protein